MSAPRPLRPDPPRALIVSGLGAPGGEARLEELEALLAPLALETVSVLAGGGEPLPPPAGFGALVVDGDPGRSATPEWLAELESGLGGGLALLALVTPDCAGESTWARFLGVAAGAEHPLGEWFAKVTLPGGILERLPQEFPVWDRPVALEVAGGDVVPIVSVSIGFAERTVMGARRVGRGGITVCGLGRHPGSLGRDELRTALARAVVAPSALSRNRSLGFGVVGYGPYGGMGLYHGLAASATTGLEMIAACDSDPSRRKAAEQEFPGLRPYASVEELAGDDDVDIAMVATPPSTHFELAQLLLAAGKHVALEKPMCLSVEEADHLIGLAASNGLALTVHQSRRWDPDFLSVRRAVGKGLIGQLFNVETFVGGFEHPCRAWHSEVAVSGGAVYDWGSHHLDWILQLMGGFPERLVAHGHKRVWRDVTNLDQVRVRLTWADGREAEFLQSDVSAIRRPKFFLQGTEGTIAGHYRPLRFEHIEPGVGYVAEDSHHAEAPVALTLARYEPGYGITETQLPPAPADRYGFHRNLADHLLLGEPLAVSPESAREVVALLEAAARSTDEGNVPVVLTRP